VEFYLRSPSQYPGETVEPKDIKLKEADRKEIVESTAEKARMI
jgi:hypothetical protein